MLEKRPHYLNGEGIHVGDRVRYKGTAGNIVFISDGEGGEFSPAYAEYDGCEAGIMVCDDDGTLTTFTEPDENLELIHHKS